jgi:hypothetical protein
LWDEKLKEKPEVVMNAESINPIRSSVTHTHTHTCAHVHTCTQTKIVAV